MEKHTYALSEGPKAKNSSKTHSSFWLRHSIGHSWFGLQLTDV